MQEIEERVKNIDLVRSESDLLELKTSVNSWKERIMELKQQISLDASPSSTSMLDSLEIFRNNICAL